MRYHRQQARSAFTLVEMMVAMALTIFIMTILSQAFIQGLETFSSLKAIGDLQANLRAATQIIRDDLAQDHFTGKRRMSDPNFAQNVPIEGFIVLGSSRHYDASGSWVSLTKVPEGGDTETPPIPSHRATDFMHFTSKKRGNKRESFFSAPCPAALLGAQTNFNLGTDSVMRDTAGVFTSPWAEIAYYLERTGSTVEPLVNTSNLGTALYALYRKELVVVVDNAAANALALDWATTIGSYTNICCVPDPDPTNSSKLWFSDPSNLANPSYRAAFHNNRARSNGATLLLTNVLSLQVEAMDNSGEFVDVPAFATPPTNNPPLTNAVRITIRIWDVRSQQTRQTTIIQEL